MSKPRIYIAIANFHPQVGGAESQSLAHTRTLCERGYEVTVVTFRHQRAWPQRETIEGVPVIRVAGSFVGNRERLPSPLRRLAYLSGLLTIAWTLWWHRRRYDVLCVFQLRRLTMPAALTSLLAHKPLMFVLRAASEGSGKAKQLTPLVSLQGQRQQVGDVEGFMRMWWPLRRYALRLLHRTHAVLVVLSSRMEREVMALDATLPVLCIPNGVDARRFAPAWHHSVDEERARTVVCVARLAYPKGVDVLLHAWQLVQEQAPQARLIIVGRGPMREQLERLAEDVGVVSTVDFTGVQSDVPAQLHRAGLAVLASRSEGMPNAVLEAMACGLPCVATRVSGSEDIIQHGVNGLLVEPEDPPSLARALVTLLQDPALTLEYGRAARATVEQRYSHQRITDMYVALYEQLANGSQPCRPARARVHPK